MFDLIGNETVSESQKFDQLKIHGFFPKSSICMFFICQNHLWRAIPSYMVSSLSLLAQNLVLVPVYLLSLTFTVELRPKIRCLRTLKANSDTRNSGLEIPNAHAHYKIKFRVISLGTAVG